MNVCPVITLRQGATSAIQLDLSEFDFQGGKVVFSIRNMASLKPVKMWEFTEQGKYAIVFEKTFTRGLRTDNQYKYDVMWHLNGERFAQCEPTEIKVKETVGGYNGID